LTEDYDISKLNGLANQKFLPGYRHYLYEGVAVSVMNRRRGELIRNIDFIDKVPVKYRHYFLLELGRVICSYPTSKAREEKLDYALKKFAPFFGSYIYRGFVEALASQKTPQAHQRAGIPKEYLLYYDRVAIRNIFGDLPSELDIPAWLAKLGITEENERYFYWGIVEAFFKDNNGWQEEQVKHKIETIASCNWKKKELLCEGLGLSLGYLTFGHIDRFAGPIGSSLNDEQLSHFYYGYCRSLKERYGLDVSRMKGLIDSNVPARFRTACYRVIWQPTPKTEAYADIR
jgi:hypothetical protein